MNRYPIDLCSHGYIITDDQAIHKAGKETQGRQYYTLSTLVSVATSSLWSPSTWDALLSTSSVFK